MKDFSSLKHVHILGVAGTLMGAFATFLKRSGVRVTGTDQNVYPPMSDVLAQAGVEVFQGYGPANLEGIQPDLVVVGNVIRRDNPEVVAVQERGLDFSSLPQMMEEYLLPKTTNVLACGTHGKTTTSSLMAHVLKEAGRDPSYFIGGVVPSLKHSFHVSQVGQGEFVLEGDEYDTAFWDKVPKFNHYLPDHVILTSVEFDHIDIYADMGAVRKAFVGLVDRMRPGGHIIACSDYPEVVELMRAAPCEVITYGRESGADFQLGSLTPTEEGTRFEVIHGGGTSTLEIPMHGAYNCLNALAVWIEGRKLGLDINPHFASFQGIKRRMEIRGEPGGVTVIDDFAHHPTAVRETLTALRARYPERRLVVAFEPRSATSRHNVFQEEFAQALKLADKVFIAPPFDQSRIEEGRRFSSQALCEAVPGAEELGEDPPGQVRAFAQEGDVVAVLSNGGFGGLIPALLQLLQ